MNRKKAIAGILAITGISLVGVSGLNFFQSNSTSSKDKLESFIDLIAELAELIIPKTETAGAKKTGVHNYIVNYIENCCSKKEYRNFLNGLIDLENESEDNYNMNFINCTLEQKIKLLNDLDNQSGNRGLMFKIKNKLLGRSFFNLLKSLTIEGYCTSYEGATKHLEYIQVPGKYKSITKLGENQKSWATK